MSRAALLLMLRDGCCSSTCAWPSWPLLTILILQTATEPRVAFISCPWAHATVLVTTLEIILAYGSVLFARKFALVHVIVLPHAQPTKLELDVSFSSDSLCRSKLLLCSSLAMNANS